MEDKRTMDEVFAEFEEFAVGEVNETYGGYLFNAQCQHEGKSFENFLTVIRSLINTCNHCDTWIDSILRDHILLGIRDSDIQT